MKKINQYVFIQIFKSCTLVFFIFVSIAWLMQLSRLLSAMNNLQIEFLAIFSLSLWLVPNLINVTLPFIIIFGLVFAFAKLDKDKEIIAIYSLGLSIDVSMMGGTAGILTLAFLVTKQNNKKNKK